MKHVLLIIVACLLFLPATFAQKLKTVKAEYTYYAPENVTLEHAKHIALERAMIQALADEFGTIVTQQNATRVENRNGQSDIDFLSIGGSEVKGEWIETIGEPIYNIRYEGNMLVVDCKVKGKAREIISAGIDFQVHILRNGTDDKFEADQFRNGDDLFLSFQSPVSGYLAVYLVDASEQAYCLLPYRNQADGIYPIKANQHYLFFNIKEAPQQERPYVDEYVMTCEHEVEYNQLYVIFSPNQFVKASDNATDDRLPRELNNTDFQRWLANCRKHDKEMNLLLKSIKINQCDKQRNHQSPKK